METDKLYRIKRKNDNRYYLSKSKFTKYGTYFRIEQLKMNLNWVLTKYSQKDLTLEIYEVKQIDNINLSKDDTIESIMKKTNRNIIIDGLL